MTSDAGLDLSFRDSSLPVEERVERLLRQMTVAEKAGLFFHSIITMGPNGQLADAAPMFGLPATSELVADRLINHFNLAGVIADPAETAQWHNRLQELAASTRLGIPITLSTDPRHAFTDNPGAALAPGSFSQWPEPIGLAAIGDAELVASFADIARHEYTAVGLRVALHPQVDLATEPRWARQVASFGEDADLSGRLASAYIRGFQGDELGPESVATVTKHFPGGGPQKDGEDPHFAYGREQVYPGGMFDLHLKPFEAALAAGTSQIMPYYGMPVGTQYEEVGFGFNRSVITGLLRERYGFDGIVCTDWGLITDHEIAGAPFPARAWGAEHLSLRERMIKVLEAGADQFGGEHAVPLLIDLIESGDVSEQRIDESARRLLREKFRLGLFDHPYVDPATGGRRRRQRRVSRGRRGRSTGGDHHPDQHRPVRRPDIAAGGRPAVIRPGHRHPSGGRLRAPSGDTGRCRRRDHPARGSVRASSDGLRELLPRRPARFPRRRDRRRA